MMADMSRSSSKKTALVAVFFLFTCTAGSCATGASGVSGVSGASVRRFAVVKDGRVAFDGAAAFTVRDGGARASVVSVTGVGEVIVPADGGACKVVLAERGVVALRILDGMSDCADVVGDRLCFDGAAFVGAGSRVVVDGCADRNELFLDRAEGDTDGAGLGPRTLIERCVEVPKPNPGFVRVDDLVVEGVADPRRGLRFRWNGDGFDVCFLSGKSGHYRARVFVDGRDVVVEGDVADL